MILKMSIDQIISSLKELDADDKLIQECKNL